MSSTVSFRESLTALLARRDLTAQQVRDVMQEMMSGRCPEGEAAAILIALRMKGESALEIAAAAQVLREHMVCWQPDCDDVLDTCGTGGDGLGTFNISTATALVAAGAGVPVVKHGNRSVSSRTGSADVLTALGVRIDGDAALARRFLQEAGFAFCFAPNFHPALKHMASLRRRLGVPTIFNILGPLANPAGARRQLLGVGRLDLLDLMAEALALLGTAHAVIVASLDGLDEVSLSAPTEVREVRGGEVRRLVWTPEDFGLPTCTLAELAVADAQESATMIQRILAGEELAATDVVLANVAAALVAAERVERLRDGVEQARQALVEGKAAAVLERLQGLSRATSNAVATGRA